MSPRGSRSGWIRYIKMADNRARFADHSGERQVRNLEVRGSIPLSSTKKSLLEPLSKSKVSGEDFFIAFRKASFPLIACIVPIVRQIWAM